MVVNFFKTNSLFSTSIIWKIVEKSLQMRRFRYLQRLLTKYQRRTMRTVEELLRSTLFSAPKQRFEQENEKLDEGTLEKVLKVAPYILSDS